MQQTINADRVIEMVERLYRGVPPREAQKIIDCICDEFYAWIFHIVSASVNNLEDAEDVVQDVQIDLTIRLERQQYDPQKSVKAYVRLIIRKHVIDYLREKLRANTTSSEALSLDTGEQEISNSWDILLVSRIKEPHEDIFMEENFVEFYERLKRERNYERLLAVLQTQYEIYMLDKKDVIQIKMKTAQEFGVTYGTIQNDIKRLSEIATACGLFDGK